MIVKDLCSSVTDGTEVSIPGLDVTRIGTISIYVVCRTDCCGIPGGVVVYSIAEPKCISVSLRVLNA